MLSALLAAGLAVAPAAGFDGAKLEWRGQQAHMTSAADGGYVLDGPFGTRRIPAAPLRSRTASPLVDGLFAMAQQELAENSVDAIRDPAYDHGAPMPCRCYVTGVKWPYVWTRDVSYAIDLGLWRFDAQRARDSLRFKLSEARAGTPGLYVMQDTGSGGSWPISTDRVVWFLAARHLLDDPGFAADARRALRDTLAQERAYTYDAAFGLYRGETSFLDWREQTYPAWTQNDVAFIGQSFALSTNVLHYQALELAATQAQAHGDVRAAGDYHAQAESLKAAINRHFWREDRGLYMSYIGGDGTPYDTYDLLGSALAVTSGVAEGERARQALAHYPTWPAGSPVIWPERRDQPVYHNRAIWPFVSAYALRAARATDDPARIAHELVSILRGAALAGSNMENYELQTQAVHVDEGTLSGPVVNSPRQLWSVAAALEAMLEGVFGLTGEDRIEPKLPAALVPALFGKGRAIALDLPDRRIVLQRPAAIDGNLLVTDRIDTQGRLVTVTLKAVHVRDTPLRLDAPLYAPEAPPAPAAEADGDGWRVPVEGGAALLYVNRRPHGRPDGHSRASRSAVSERHPGRRERHRVPAQPRHLRRTDHAPRGRSAPRMDGADGRLFPRGARLHQSARPDQHRHHRRGENAGDRMRRRRLATRAAGDAAQRRRAALDLRHVHGPRRRGLPFHTGGRLQHELSRPRRALHRRGRRRDRAAQ